MPPKKPMIAVPCVPRKRESRPAITSAAMRPCRLAGPASATRPHSPVTGVLDLDRVADGEDVGLAGAHLIVDADAAARADREAAVLASATSGRTPSARIDHVGRIHRARLRQHLQRAVLARLEAGDAVVQHQPQAVALQVGLRRCAPSPASSGARICAPISTSVTSKRRWIRFSAVSMPMKPPPIDHRARLRPHRLEARSSGACRPGRASPSHPFADRARVGHGAQLEDAGQVDAGQRRADRRRAGREHQLVVGLGRNARRWPRRAA